MVANALQIARNEQKLRSRANCRWVLHHMGNEIAEDAVVKLIHLFIAVHDFHGQFPPLQKIFWYVRFFATGLATPLALEPMAFHWDVILHAPGKAKLAPLVLAATEIGAIRAAPGSAAWARAMETALANKTVGKLSGGELQRLRVGQAVIGSPDLILADEPLSALDLHQQRTVAELLENERTEHNAAVLFVTHDVNPILGMVDRVLYLANGQFRIGTPDEVLRSEVLSELYGTAVDVVRNQGRIVVVGVHEHDHHPDEEWH